ncbi:MAG: imidazoleglycerol-phosphate dehydratase HisB [Candidatus Heimdallarchaeota archaeon]|nr:imidazoleglycerol-phosphate dehydratase HisB [Candidatus Heimdallarchaeota archaeon]
MRCAVVERKSAETEISVSIFIDGAGKSQINTPIGFLNHMLEAFSKYSNFDVKIDATGDLHVDQHHLVEDLGLVIGEAIKKALGDRKGIERAGFFIFPMDETLALCSLDLSGRSYVVFKGSIRRQFVGDFDADLTKHFFESLARASGMNIFIEILEGENDHHKLEAIFKAFAKSMRLACQINENQKDEIPSTKELLDL